MARCNRWRRALGAAFPVTVPVLTGYVCLGLAYGVLMAANGYGPLWSALMSAIGFCGSMQYAVIPILAAGFEPLQAFLLTLMVNARHVLYGLSMLERYRGLGWARFPLIYTLSDETFSLVSTLDPPEGVARRDFFLCISLLDYGYWVSGTALGGLLGSVLTFNATGLDFALTALFVVLFLEQWKEPERRGAGIVGAACAAVSLAVFGPDNLVIPAMIMILAILLGGRKLTCA
ncbi:AzlC family ABC transporter permease [Oscillibacter sp.]|uniref:AzlC family ABC transporter permease n=1 Tax=Oscillibacter sp. TaxID=1945593 RepID=UPI002D7E18EC|nr:AzlC family ABC transporter permease [Oscillibacter sp.]